MTAPEHSGAQEELCSGERLIFVGGAPRSGTTLVQNVLDSHPEIAGGPEFDHVPGIVALRNQLRASVEKGRIDVFCTQRRVDAVIGRTLEELLLPFADARGRRYLSEKTPFNVTVFGDLMDIFPRSRFVFCIRDPRAVVASLLEVGKRGRAQGTEVPPFSTSVRRAINLVRRHDELGFAALRRAPERVHLVRYEALVAEPERVTRTLCAFLGLPWVPEMLAPEAARHEGERGVDGVWYSRDGYYRPIDAASLERWRDQLSPAEVSLVECTFAGDPALRQAGYEFRPTAPERLRAAGYAKLLGVRDASVSVGERLKRGSSKLRG